MRNSRVIQKSHGYDESVGKERFSPSKADIAFSWLPFRLIRRIFCSPTELPDKLRIFVYFCTFSSNLSSTSGPTNRSFTTDRTMTSQQVLPKSTVTLTQQEATSFILLGSTVEKLGWHQHHNFELIPSQLDSQWKLELATKRDHQCTNSALIWCRLRRSDDSLAVQVILLPQSAFVRFGCLTVS